MTRDAYSTAYQRGFSSTVRFLLAKGVILDEAEEVAQSAWVRGWEARDQLKDDDCVLPWVNSIAYRTLCNEKHRANRLQELSDICDQHKGPSTCTAKVDADKLMTYCSPLDRSLLIHRYAGGFDMQEIARRHGLSCVATRVRIHRTKLALRRQLSGAPVKAAA